MKLLLDTHIVLWGLLEPARLSQGVAAALDNSAHELWVSPISTWEILVLADKGRITLRPDPITWIRRVYQEIPFLQAPLNHDVAIESRSLELPYQVRIPRNSATNSTGKLPANPPESCHRFQMKVATQSGSKLPPEIGA